MAGLETKLRKTARGFQIAEFKELYGKDCSIQESSLATEAAIWLGIDAPSVRVIVKGKGWQDVPLPEGGSVRGRMHLSQEQVQDLLPLLQRFAETGYLSLDPRDWVPQS